MDCAEVGQRLVEYHFATLDDDARDALEEHLVACTACLRAYLAFKRATESGASEKPSSATRARLRASVASAFAKPTHAPVRLFARRIPLYQGLAFAAVAAALTLLAPGFVRRLSTPSTGTASKVDTSRPVADSLEIY